MGFFDSNQTFTEGLNSWQSPDSYNPNISGTLNWGDANNTTSQLQGVTFDPNRPDSLNTIQGLIDAWARKNDPSYAATFGNSPYSTNSTDASNLYSENGGDSGALSDYYTRLNDYIRSKFGSGQLALARTQVGGSSNTGESFRQDLVQQQADGSWRPINDATVFGTEPGTRSDGTQIGSIIGSWLGAYALAPAAGGAGAAEGGAGAAAGASDVPNAIGYGTEGMAGYTNPATGGSFGSTAGYGAANGLGDAGGDAAAEGLGGGTDGSTTYNELGGGSVTSGADGNLNWTGAEGAVDYSFDPNGMPNGSQYASDIPMSTTTTTSGGIDWTKLGASGLNALLQSYMTSKAADAARASTDSADATQRYIFDTLRADQAPFRQTSYGALDKINALMANPNSVTSDPGYEFQRQQGQQGIERSAAARGLGLSGAALKAASRFNTDYATTKLNDSYNRYANIAGFGQVANSQGVASGANYANQTNRNQLYAGDAQAANYLNQGNIYGNWLNQLGVRQGG